MRQAFKVEQIIYADQPSFDTNSRFYKFLLDKGLIMKDVSGHALIEIKIINEYVGVYYDKAPARELSILLNDIAKAEKEGVNFVQYEII